MTGIESKLKSVQPEGGLMKSAAPGDFVHVLARIDFVASSYLVFVLLSSNNNNHFTIHHFP
jgi:hypothetical protein